MTRKKTISVAACICAISGALALGPTGCDAFNPAFVNLVAPNAAAVYATVPNAPGYVVVAVQNNVTFDGFLLSWLQSQGLVLTPAEAQHLRARMRFRLRITFTDTTSQVVEFITGTPGIVDPDDADQAETDLDQNTLNNVVVRCDVASVQLEPGTNIEVYIPSPLEQWELVEIRVGDDVGTEPQLRGTIPPQFRGLQVDDVDEDGNVVLRRNIDTRDVLSPTTNVICGAVVAVVVDGVLTVPFFEEAGTGNPSFDINDENTVAGIGGRYEFRVGVE